MKVLLETIVNTRTIAELTKYASITTVIVLLIITGITLPVI
jgi:hypothetical protein